MKRVSHEPPSTRVRELTNAELAMVSGGIKPSDETKNPNDTPSGKLSNAPKGTPPSKPHFYHGG